MLRSATLAGLILCLSAAPGLAASCSAEIEALSKRVSEEGRQSIAAGSAGQAESAARAEQGAGGTASKAAPQEKAQASTGAERTREAKLALDEARSLDGKGDSKGCADAVARARQKLDAAP